MQSKKVSVRKKVLKNEICTTISFAMPGSKLKKMSKICKTLNVHAFVLQLFNIDATQQQRFLDNLKKYANAYVQQQDSLWDLSIIVENFQDDMFELVATFDFDEMNLIDLSFSQYLSQQSGKCNRVDVNKVWLNYNRQECNVVEIDIFHANENNMEDIIFEIKRLLSSA